MPVRTLGTLCQKCRGVIRFVCVWDPKSAPIDIWDYREPNPCKYRTDVDCRPLSILFNGSIRDWFSNNSWSPTGMSSLTYPIQPQHISEKDHDRRLRNHRGTVSIGDRTITNLRFADDIDSFAGEEEDLAKLVERLGKSLHSLRHGDQCREDEADDEQHQWHQHRE